MTASVWVLLVLVWLLAGVLIGATQRIRRLERASRLELAQRVAPLVRQESTDQLPISLALYGAWAHPGRSGREAHAEACAEVRRLHPDLGVALDRCVEVATSRANLAARRPDPVSGVSLPSRAPGVECARGRHSWRAVVGVGVERCEGCGEIRTVA